MKILEYKLDKINDTIQKQNGLISSFAQDFATYADTSLMLQSDQLQELVSINQNTSEIKTYTQALTRTKLVELELLTKSVLIFIVTPFSYFFIYCCIKPIC